MEPRIDLAALETQLRQHVAVLAQMHRTPRTRAHRQAADYVNRHLHSSGFSVRESPFTDVGLPGTNLLTIPEHNSTDLPLLIIGAHYDTVPESPGADDNASGVAALLELARWIRPDLLSGGPFSAALQLAAYDLEEYGMVGSMVHARELKRTRPSIRGMISLEMLGYTDHRPGSQRLPPHLARFYPNVGSFIGVCGNEASRALVQSVAQSMKIVEGLPVESIAVSGNGELLPEVRLSDHSSFWDRGYQALMITDTSFFRNPHYHQTNDTPQTLDYPFLAKVTAGVCEAVARITRSNPRPASRGSA